MLTKRNVDTKYVNTVVNLVEHKYNTQRQHVVEEREIPGENRDLRDCNCDSPVRRMAWRQAANAYGSAPKYVKNPVLSRRGPFARLTIITKADNQLGDRPPRRETCGAVVRLGSCIRTADRLALGERAVRSARGRERGGTAGWTRTTDLWFHRPAL